MLPYVWSCAALKTIYKQFYTWMLRKQKMKRILVNSYGLCVPMKTMAHLREHQCLLIFTHHYPGKRGTKGVQKTVHENRSWQKKAYKCEQNSVQMINLLFCLPFFAIQTRIAVKLKRWQNHSSENQQYFQLSQIAFGTPWLKVPGRSCICRLTHSYRWKHFSFIRKVIC